MFATLCRSCLNYVVYDLDEVSVILALLYIVSIIIIKYYYLFDLCVVKTLRVDMS